ncbi:hypothetical protein PN471_16395 [Aphanizomenon sp. CS-733/32]|uniref:hypothetical protein n=1 Tax=Aphanizomenon sp. CS-733/32 TaxID=3021715 RepID=UPI00232B9365|nr:hypothetical protein [Aphanizomenon sp. CS-733/32]MDB9310184.1 hypothetical protein [Aphanizomenon sp. CS-733/32]
MKHNLNYFTSLKNITIILALIVFSSITGCSSTDRCEFLRDYSEKRACQEHNTVEIWTNLVSFGFLGYVGYVLFTKPAWFCRLIYSTKQNLDSNQQAKEPIIQALNELVLLTGGYFDGKKYIYQEVRLQDRKRVIELCQFILENENPQEKSEGLNIIATELEKKGKDLKSIDELRQAAEFNINLGQSVKQLLEQVKSSQ